MRDKAGLRPGLPGRSGSPLCQRREGCSVALCVILLGVSSPRAGTCCRFLCRFCRCREVECHASSAEDFLWALAVTVTNDSNLCIHSWSPMDRIDNCQFITVSLRYRTFCFTPTAANTSYGVKLCGGLCGGLPQLSHKLWDREQKIYLLTG